MSRSQDHTLSDAGTVDPLLDDDGVAKVLTTSVPSVWRYAANGTIPKPIKIGRLSRWPLSEILAVIDAAKARRSNPEPLRENPSEDTLAPGGGAALTKPSKRSAKPDSKVFAEAHKKRS